MVHKTCLVLTLVVLAGRGATPVLAQALPPTPVPVSPTPPPGPAPILQAPVSPPPALPPPPPGGLVSPPPGGFEDRNGPLLRGDPLLDRPGYPQPGWFGAF